MASPLTGLADSAKATAPAAAAATAAAEGHRLFPAGQFDDAGLKLETAVSFAQDPQVLFELAVCYERLDRDAEALSAFRAYRRLPVALRIREADQHIQAIESKQAPAHPTPASSAQFGKSRRVVVPVGDDGGKCYRECAAPLSRCGRSPSCWAVRFSCLRDCPGARVEPGSCLGVPSTSSFKCAQDHWP